ncbi:PorP/SprF family type IX secretion system membrane protein [Chitinophaga rhizophila]|uniref:Type IX secretion system membrane protein PorP/SprF n=1 Tax=Chitinophaga rhizophila TaxID=2866212 RepID=A0ABS7G6A3_9BACT|nr:type IX secretion system membrane protein PorP/SprF [Chitinophaga rhizophila]MBW8682986.1 type IX secretion system membrane protein PorP/SprF [Chitinophaga rhizophila]
MKRNIILMVLLMLGKLSFAQQDAQFSQYMFNGIYINPAYAGYKEALNLHGYYRNQWSGIEGAPRSFSLALDNVSADGNVGWGVQVATDRLGAQTAESVYGNYAYRIRTNEDGTARLSFGFSLGVVQLGINGRLLWTQDPETEIVPGVIKTMVPDARAGIFYADQQFYAGISVDNLVSPHVNKSKYAFIPQPKPHYYLTAGMMLPLNEQLQIRPSFLLKDDRGGPTSLDLNVFILFKEMLWLGGGYRTRVDVYSKEYLQKALTTSNAAIAAIEVFPTENLRIGYAYDFSIGPLQNYNSGTHELSIGFTLRSAASEEKRRNMVSCPKFF